MSRLRYRVKKFIWVNLVKRYYADWIAEESEDSYKPDREFEHHWSDLD